MKPAKERRRQCADAVLMVRPRAFRSNPETADSNRFQQPDAGADAPIAARLEFDALVTRLTGAGVTVHVAEDTPAPTKPDACFPNNWVSFHADGSVVLYPMMAPSRRAERRPEMIDGLRLEGYRVTRTVDLSGWEARGEFLEGTGSLVLDRCHRIAYACRSPRTGAGPLAEFAATFGFRVVSFDARGPGGVPVYHTNVLMAVGDRFAVLCPDAIADDGERAQVERSIVESGHELIRIGIAEMNGFAGNLLALAAGDGAPVIAMSTAARECLSAGARRALERHGSLVAAPIPTIERYGGGSVRCMIAEVFLPR